MAEVSPQDEFRLMAITPIDGRYASQTAPLRDILSEHGLIRRRVAVEAAWLTALSDAELPGVEPLGDAARDYLQSAVSDFSSEDSVEIKAIEKQTNHDVNAVVRWLQGKTHGLESFAGYEGLIHFGATSEDINNLAYGLQLRDTRDQVLLPGFDRIAEALEAKALDYADLPMLGHTHGQPATPTTLGKEFRVFSERVRETQRALGAVTMYGKFNGATGNFNALAVAYPDVDWPRVAADVVRSFGFEVNHTTTQIEPHDWEARFMNEVALGNTQMIDLARDAWSYISMRYLKQAVKPGEVGSSTMPHKVNPIDFENAEANFGIGNALLVHLAGKLPVSRLQRDLSDSSAQRAFGEAFGHTVVGHSALARGLGKVSANEALIIEDLNNNPEVLTEAIQIVMRSCGVEDAYDIIKEASRGRNLSTEKIHELVRSMGSLPADAKEKLLSLTPSTYIGLAPKIARGEV